VVHCAIKLVSIRNMNNISLLTNYLATRKKKKKLELTRLVCMIFGDIILFQAAIIKVDYEY
jgi:hypothetical protein